ncbi:hypothetical protein GGR21_001067 [Dysgonomonas hofstadii]|uniref:DUF3857 domain-containing protein n=1 Tax=Dysgonomonas hofstadii TaxID=637886 RepID=A0A840CMA9_9BACT|nr:DUF3857 domain-containing protein [Dysgonomonas hofstadii]MBB4035178.1 hypothetical protein [Dysgonomonas hofstadii]
MKFFVLIVSLLISFPCFGQTPRSEIIEHISVFKIKGDKLERTDSITLQINERMGDNDAEIGLVYSKGDKLSIGDVWIEDMNGNIIRKLKKNEIMDNSYIKNYSLYEDKFIKSFSLKHNSYPYRMVYSYKYVFPAYIHIADMDCTGRRNPIRSAKLIVETPSDMQIKYKQKNVTEPEINTIANTKTYHWTYSYKPEGINEIKISPNTSKAPKIEILPVDFKYGIKGNTNSWTGFGNWIHKLNEGRDQLTVSEQNKIENLLSGIDNDKEKAKVLYKYLQDHTRYINVSIKIGGLQTYPASYVCDNKYGDCKALTNYMQSMLKYIGIKSHYTLIYSDENVFDIENNFATNAFNHVILTIPFEKDTVYLECTSQNTPFGYIHTEIQGRKALLIDENNSQLISIPSLKPEDVLCTRNLNVNLNTLEMGMIATERGENYEFSNFLSSDVTKNIVDKHIRKNILSGSYDLLDFKFQKENRDSAYIKMEVKCKMHNLYKEYGNNLVLNPFPIILPSYELPEKRINDVQIDYPEYYKDTIVYGITDKNITKLPDDMLLKSKFGEYSQTFTQDGNKLIICKSILIFSGRYSKEQYNEFYRFMTLVYNNENKNYYIETL